MNNGRVILIDMREKKPLPLPQTFVWGVSKDKTETIRIHHVRKTIPTGDYLLQDGGVLYTNAKTNACVIERKHSLEEISKNLLTSVGYTRFTAELERMQDFPHRLLLLEGHPERLYSTGDVRHAARTIAELQRLVMRYNVNLHFIPTSTQSHRLAVANWVVSWLLTAEELQNGSN